MSLRGVTGDAKICGMTCLVIIGAMVPFQGCDPVLLRPPEHFLSARHTGSMHQWAPGVSVRCITSCSERHFGQPLRCHDTDFTPRQGLESTSEALNGSKRNLLGSDTPLTSTHCSAKVTCQTGNYRLRLMTQMAARFCTKTQYQQNERTSLRLLLVPLFSPRWCRTQSNASGCQPCYRRRAAPPIAPPVVAQTPRTALDPANTYSLRRRSERVETLVEYDPVFEYVS